MAAFEALLRIEDSGADFAIQRLAREDPTLLIKTLAAAEMWRRGDDFGRVAIQDLAQDENDWFPRALAALSMRDLGGKDDYWKLFSRFNRERNDMVKAEAAGAILRLQRLKEE